MRGTGSLQPQEFWECLCLAHLLPWNPAPQAEEHQPDLQSCVLTVEDTLLPKQWNRHMWAAQASPAPSTIITLRHPSCQAAGWHPLGLRDIPTNSVSLPSALEQNSVLMVVGCEGRQQMRSCWAEVAAFIPPSPGLAGRLCSLTPVAPAPTQWWDMAGTGTGLWGYMTNYTVHRLELFLHVTRFGPCATSSLGQGQHPHGQGLLSLWPEPVKHVCCLKGSLSLRARDVLGPDYILNARFSSEVGDSTLLSLYISWPHLPILTPMLNAELCTQASHLLGWTGHPVPLRLCAACKAGRRQGQCQLLSTSPLWLLGRLRVL